MSSFETPPTLTPNLNFLNSVCKIEYLFKFNKVKRFDHAAEQVLKAVS